MFSGGGTLNNATISAGSTVTAQNNSTTMLQNTITNNGTIALSSAGNFTDIQLIGDVTLNGAGTLTMSNTTANRIYGSTGGQVLTNGAGHTIQGTGQIAILTNSGIVRPGVNAGSLAAGKIVITGNFTQTATGTFAVKLGGTAGPGSNYDQMTVAGAANLDGNISVSLISGYHPALNDLIPDVIDFASETGDFATHNGFAQSGNVTFQESFNPNSNPIRLNLLVVQQTVHLTSIALTPSNPSVAKGLSQQFTATGTYSDGTTQNIANQVTWVSATPAVSTISTSGLASALAVGTSTISATLGSVSGSTVLTVAAAVLQSIAVTPSNPSVAKGLTQQFTATGTYSDGTTQNIANQVTWVSATPAVSTISTSGLASALAVGTSTISATLGALVSGSTVLTVAAAVLQSIAVTPSNPSVAKGLTQQFTATGTYSDGTTQNLANQVTWASATPAVSTISTSGLASALAIGTSTISATLGLFRVYGTHGDGGSVAIHRGDAIKSERGQGP